MITSKKQYKAASEQLEMLNASLLAPKKSNVPDVIEKAGKAQLRGLIEKITAEIQEYEKYKNLGDLSKLEIHSLDDLTLLPIRYRLVSNMSVDAFSRLVGVSARQISRYEKDSYKNIHTSTLNTILSKLNVDIEGGIVSNNQNYSEEPEIHPARI